tara:strand:+ start:61 stop:654 length:594 start_codon:yes stop_codon:yes gene_type:complete
MENWRSFIESSDKEEEILEEGWKEWLLPVLMATNLTLGSPSASQAAPKERAKSQVQQIIVRGGMSQKQKNKLLKMEGNLRLLLVDLNGQHRKRLDSQLTRSVRSMNMRILGMKPQDWPYTHVITMKELKDFLATGKLPEIKEPAKKKPKEKSWTDNLDNWAYDVGQGMRKGLKWVDRKSPIGANTGWFDDDKAPPRP